MKYVILHLKNTFLIIKVAFAIRIAVFSFYSSVFLVNLMILAKNINFRGAVPLRFWLEKNHKKASKRTNKQYFSCFSPSKVLYHYVGLWIGIWEKNSIWNTEKNLNFCFSLKTLLFVVVILYCGLEGADFKILTPG